MNDTTVEQKLQLVRQVRSRYHENQFDMSNRERILYGKTAITPEKMQYGDRYGEDPDGRLGGMARPEGIQPSIFGIRFFIAALLLTVIIVMDKNEWDVAGITAEKIFQVISADYEDTIEEWVEAMSH